MTTITQIDPDRLAKNPNQMIESGIHFGLSADLYHADPALGSTSIKEIAADPTEWQWNNLHGEEKDTAALLWGSALHVRVLEGRLAFETAFACEPSRSYWPSALVTMDDLRAHASGLGVKAGKSKAEAISNIRAFDTTTPIWDEILSRFTAENAGKRIISQTVWRQIQMAADWMQADPLLAPVMKDGTFCAGASEVSIFYEDNGVRLKCRLDHLLQHGVLDLKSFRPPPGWTTRMPAVNRILGRVIAQMRYDIQAASYLRGWERARKMAGDGRVFGATKEQTKILDAALTQDAMKWIWVLVKNSGAPQPFVREFDSSSFAIGSARDAVEDAIASYKKFVAEFDLTKDWTPRHPADVLGDTEFPAYLGL
jgi:PDDEXK-like domain of unknown function (DUF3799)